MTRLERAYLAGLFDGEGSICISRIRPNFKNRDRNPRYFLLIEIANTNRPILEWIAASFGGRISLKSGRTSGARPCYAWHASKAIAEKFLHAVRPYAKIKSAQIEVALEYRDTLATFKWHSKQPWTLNRSVQIKEQFRSKLRVLNHRQEVA